MDRLLICEAEAIGRSRARQKCAVCVPDSATRTRVASALDLPEDCDGVVVAGSPVGNSDFVDSFAQEHTEAVEDLACCQSSLCNTRTDKRFRANPWCHG
jgi:hypothetical protein